MCSIFPSEDVNRRGDPRETPRQTSASPADVGGKATRGIVREYDVPAAVSHKRGILLPMRKNCGQRAHPAVHVGTDARLQPKVRPAAFACPERCYFRSSS
jgi:hypothetical protein